MCDLLSHGQLFVTPWTAAHQASLSLRFSRQRYWSGLPFPSPGALPNPGIKPRSPALQAESSSSIKYLYYSEAGCQIGCFSDFHYKYRNYFLYPLLFLPQNWRGNKIHSIMLSMDLGLACKYNLWCYILQNNISFTFKWCVYFLPDDLPQETIYGNSFNLFKSNFT